MIKHDQHISSPNYLIEPNVVLTCLIPYLSFNDFRNLYTVSMDFCRILQSAPDQHWIVNVDNSDVLQMMSNYYPQKTTITDDSIILTDSTHSEFVNDEPRCCSMIRFARGIKISNQSLIEWHNKDQMHNCEIIGKFLNVLVENGKKHILLELPITQLIDSATFYSIIKHCASFHSLTLHVPQQQSPHQSICEWIYHFKSLKELTIKIWDDSTHYNSTNEYCLHRYVNMYLPHAKKSCERIIFEKLFKHPAITNIAQNQRYEFTFTTSEEGPELKSLTLVGVIDLHLVPLLLDEKKMMGSLKSLKMDRCWTGNDLNLPSLEYLEVNNSNHYYRFIEDWKMPNLQTLIYTKSKSRIVPKPTSQHLKRVILDHQAISHIEPGHFEQYKQLAHLSMQHNKLTSFEPIQHLPLLIPNVNFKNNPFKEVLIVNNDDDKKKNQIEILHCPKEHFKIEFSPTLSYEQGGHFIGCESKIFRELRRAIVKTEFINITNSRQQRKNIIFWNRTFLDPNANHPQVGIPTETTHFAVYLEEKLRSKNGGLSWLFFSVFHLSDGNVNIVQVKDDRNYDEICLELSYIVNNWRHFTKYYNLVKRLKSIHTSK